MKELSERITIIATIYKKLLPEAAKEIDVAVNRISNNQTVYLNRLELMPEIIEEYRSICNGIDGYSDKYQDEKALQVKLKKQFESVFGEEIKFYYDTETLKTVAFGEIVYCNLVLCVKKNNKFERVPIKKVVWKRTDGRILFSNRRVLNEYKIKDASPILEIDIIKRMGFEQKPKK